MRPAPFDPLDPGLGDVAGQRGQRPRVLADERDRASVDHRTGHPGEVTGGLPAQRVQTGQPQRVGRGGEHRGGTQTLRDPPGQFVRAADMSTDQGDDESSGLVDHDHAGIGLLVGE